MFKQQSRNKLLNSYCEILCPIRNMLEIDIFICKNGVET
jgi:hypothetical protein